jgi:hypothetical protein
MTAFAHGAHGLRRTSNDFGCYRRSPRRRRQRKQLGFNERIVGLLGKLLTPRRLITQVVKPIMYVEHSTVGLGAVTIHGGAFSRTPNA